MRTIASLQDLRHFGIFTLTGEADNLSYRILCDVSASGQSLLREVYCMEPNSPPWNNHTEGKKHVASVMLTPRAWQDIGPIALVQVCHTVFSTDQCLWGLQGKEQLKKAEWGINEETDEIVMKVPPQYSIDGEIWYKWPYDKIQRFYSHLEVPHQGTRNIHAISGRII